MDEHADRETGPLSLGEVRRLRATMDRRRKERDEIGELVLMWFQAPYWGAAEAERWKALTGSEDATTKVLCDTVRRFIKKENVPGRGED